MQSTMNAYEIETWLRETDPIRLEMLWKQADLIRAKEVGDQVHLRGLIELSNICRRQCLYCGIRAGNSALTRYRLTNQEVLDAARKAIQFEYGSIVIQSGEDAQLDPENIARLIRQIKGETDLAITLSLGERSIEDYHLWKQAGADRYLLRFETSNRRLFQVIHPAWKHDRLNSNDRLQLLRELRGLGYEIGSGVMVGIPGQSYTDLTNDLLLFRELNLNMIGSGPFLLHPQTPLGQLFLADRGTGLLQVTEWTKEQRAFFEQNDLPVLAIDDQVAHSDQLAFKVIALARLLCPRANIPSTTAIATIDRENGRKMGLSRGANVVMPNLTPLQYRRFYEIYPNKAASYETPEETHAQMLQHLAAIGRIPGKGRGDSR